MFLVGCGRESAEELYGLNPYGGAGSGLGGGNSVLIKADSQNSCMDFFFTNSSIYKVKENMQGQSNSTYKLKYSNAGKIDSVILSINQGVFAVGKLEDNSNGIKKS